MPWASLSSESQKPLFLHPQWAFSQLNHIVLFSRGYNFIFMLLYKKILSIYTLPTMYWQGMASDSDLENAYK